MATEDSNRRICSTAPFVRRHSAEGVYLRRILAWSGVAIVAVIGVDLIVTNRPGIGFAFVAIATAGAARMRYRTQPGRPLTGSPDPQTTTRHNREESLHGPWWSRLEKRPPTTPLDRAPIHIGRDRGLSKKRIERHS